MARGALPDMPRSACTGHTALAVLGPWLLGLGSQNNLLVGSWRNSDDRHRGLRSPFAPVGSLTDRLLLTRYMTGLLRQRNAWLKAKLEHTT